MEAVVGGGTRVSSSSASASLPENATSSCPHGAGNATNACSPSTAVVPVDTSRLHPRIAASSLEHRIKRVGAGSNFTLDTSSHCGVLQGSVPAFYGGDLAEKLRALRDLSGQLCDAAQVDRSGLPTTMAGRLLALKERYPIDFVDLTTCDASVFLTLYFRGMSNCEHNSIAFGVSIAAPLTISSVPVRLPCGAVAELCALRSITLGSGTAQKGTLVQVHTMRLDGELELLKSTNWFKGGGSRYGCTDNTLVRSKMKTSPAKLLQIMRVNGATDTSFSLPMMAGPPVDPVSGQHRGGLLPAQKFSEEWVPISSTLSVSNSKWNRTFATLDNLLDIYGVCPVTVRVGVDQLSTIFHPRFDVVKMSSWLQSGVFLLSAIGQGPWGCLMMAAIESADFRLQDRELRALLLSWKSDIDTNPRIQIAARLKLSCLWLFVKDGANKKKEFVILVMENGIIVGFINLKESFLGYETHSGHVTLCTYNLGGCTIIRPALTSQLVPWFDVFCGAHENRRVETVPVDELNVEDLSSKSGDPMKGLYELLVVRDMVEANLLKCERAGERVCVLCENGPLAHSILRSIPASSLECVGLARRTDMFVDSDKLQRERQLAKEQEAARASKSKKGKKPQKTGGGDGGIA